MLQHWIYFSNLTHVQFISIYLEFYHGFQLTLKCLDKSPKMALFCQLKTNMIYIQTPPSKLTLADDKPKYLELESFTLLYSTCLFHTKLTLISKETSHSRGFCQWILTDFILPFLVSDKILLFISRNLKC